MIRILPSAVFAVITLIGVCMTAVVYDAEESSDRIRFESIADETVDRVVARVNQHIALLISAHAFFTAQSGDVSRPAFERYVTSLDLKGEFVGIRGIGYARVVPKGAEQPAQDDLSRNYGIEREIWPQTSQRLRTPIVLLEPIDQRNLAALGYDMFSDVSRRDAMLKAIEAGEPRASAPVELVQEITENKQTGFLVYIPFSARTSQGAEDAGRLPDTAVDGFVYAPFRAGDLHLAALERVPPLPVTVDTADTTGDAPVDLFHSRDFSPDQSFDELTATRIATVAGRQWTFSIHATPAFRGNAGHFYTILIGTISLLLAIALAMSTRFQIKSVETAHALRKVSEKTIQEKDLMLQEMKHRIKNSIARVLAISRQTAANSKDIDEFAQSFSARLHSMANAQDMLTRSHWQRADLHELLSTELEQVFGGNYGKEKIDGPQVLLDERTTQALGLTFHELATNALKYGGVSTNDGDLAVHWQIIGKGSERKLHLDWIETTVAQIEEPQQKGFGSRLIDANIKGELGGTLERTFRPDGMSFQMTIPI